MESKHHYFSKQASAYKQYRPTYPKELFAYLGSLSTHRDCVWDCATGNGQAAIALADYFDKVIATDVSAEQLSHAVPHPNVDYRVAKAEASNLPDHSVDMVTVAQALHWFDFDKFYQEVRRVVKPGGYLAVWTYPFSTFEDGNIQNVYMDFALGDLKNYWPPERVHCDTRYQHIPFPFEEVKTPTFFIPMSYTRDQFVGYLESWSAVQRYKNQHQINPVQTILLPKLEKVWPEPKKTQNVKIDIVLRVGKVL